MTIKLMRLKQVEEAVGVKKSTIYKWIGNGYFPPPVKLGARAVAWRTDDLEQWILDCSTSATETGCSNMSLLFLIRDLVEEPDPEELELLEQWASTMNLEDASYWFAYKLGLSAEKRGVLLKRLKNHEG